MKTAALNSTFRRSYIDHISPLASLLNIPLIISDEQNALLTQKYYPEIPLRYVPNFSLRIGEFIREFDQFFDCDYWGKGQKKMLELLYKKPMRTIFCPHGQSDKGYHSSCLAPYQEQETILIYGELMQEMLTELGILKEGQKRISIGNFRYEYYLKHQTRLDMLIQKEVFARFKRENPTLLFAPTWNDLEQSGTLFDYGTKLLKELPSHWNLIIKVHPDLPEHQPALFQSLNLTQKECHNVVVIVEFPLIYPILNKIDAYLGDYSSIGYDVLCFQKPMFFLQKTHLKKMRLHHCGALLDGEKGIFSEIEKGLLNQKSYLEKQALLYKRAFDQTARLEKVLGAKR